MANLLQDRSHKYASSEMIQSFLKKVPRLPVYTGKVAALLFDENVSTRDVAQIAKLDPSLVGAVLKSVNSAYYGFQRKISDFQHALLLLGFNQVYQLVVDIGIRSTMPKTPEFRELQFHSMMVSFISFEISQLYNMKRPVTDSTIGLLHDTGKSFILLLKKRHSTMTLLVDIIDHEKIGSLLLKEWNIPDEICRTLEYQGYPELLPPEQIPAEYRKNVAVLYVAHLCYEYLQGKSEYNLTTPFLSEYMNLLGSSEGTISGLVRKEILPRLNKSLNTFPQDVRHFLTKSVDHVMGKVTLDRLNT